MEDFQVLTVPKLHPPPSWKRISALFSCWQPIDSIIEGQIQAFSFVSVCLLSVLVRKLSVPTPKAVISLLCVLHKLQETSCLAPSRIGATETRPSTAVDWKSRFWPAEFHQHYVSIVGHFTCRGVWTRQRTRKSDFDWPCNSFGCFFWRHFDGFRCWHRRRDVEMYGKHKTKKRKDRLSDWLVECWTANHSLGKKRTVSAAWGIGYLVYPFTSWFLWRSLARKTLRALRPRLPRWRTGTAQRCVIWLTGSESDGSFSDWMRQWRRAQG